MSCYRPLTGYRSRYLNPTGKRSIVFSKQDAYSDLVVNVPCGRCIGCRLETSRQWAIRCVHEAQLHENNCFITLTYNDEHLPRDLSLNLRHYQLFMKKLRKKFGSDIRFFHAGEYGEKFGRPHYHACLFNFDFPDKVHFRTVPGGHQLYVSDTLSKLWGYGFATIGDVTFESAAYVARYIMKKQKGPSGDYLSTVTSFDPDTGEVLSRRKPEYTTMSRRPGIASGWFERFNSDILINDKIVIKGKQMQPPKFYDRLFEARFPSDYVKIKAKRRKNAERPEIQENCTPERLAIREEVKTLITRALIRPVDSVI